jgi:transcriptional regulator with XRE-family HTH domain
MTSAGGPTGSPSSETVAATVAQHVRGLRTSRSWSLEELAGRSGVSKGMVVQIEGARTNPSIGTLCRIADAFGVTVARLLEAPDEPPMRIHPAEAAAVLWRGPDGGTARLLTGISEPHFVEVWEWRLAPGEACTLSDDPPNTKGILHVLAGTVTVSVDGADHPVTTGQTAVFRSDRPHTYRNTGAEPCHATLVTALPQGEFDRRQP